MVPKEEYLTSVSCGTHCIMGQEWRGSSPILTLASVPSSTVLSCSVDVRDGLDRGRTRFSALIGIPAVRRFGSEDEHFRQELFFANMSDKNEDQLRNMVSSIINMIRSDVQGQSTGAGATAGQATGQQTRREAREAPSCSATQQNMARTGSPNRVSIT
uniref:Uncharacterized protein n=1 Tax=Knipowitschia caucasica TaxID=637954 RepID=A0AAV2JWA6_KNICA